MAAGLANGMGDKGKGEVVNYGNFCHSTCDWIGDSSSGASALMVPAEKVVLVSPDDPVGEDLRASAAGR